MSWGLVSSCCCVTDHVLLRLQVLTRELQGLVSRGQGVSELGVSEFGVSELGVSELGVSELGVRE